MTIPDYTRQLAFLFAASLFLLLGISSSAKASTIILPPPDSVFPYHLWVGEAYVPTPNVTLKVVEDSSGCGGESAACTGPGAGLIYINPALVGSHHVRLSFFHELGHNVSYVMPDWFRNRFLHLRRETRPWDQEPDAPKEQFAEAWSLCARRAVLYRRYFGGADYEVSPRAHARICRLMRNATLAANRYMLESP